MSTLTFSNSNPRDSMFVRFAVSLPVGESTSLFDAAYRPRDWGGHEVNSGWRANSPWDFLEVPRSRRPRPASYRADCTVVTWSGPRGTVPCRSSSVQKRQPLVPADRFQSWDARQSV